MPFKKGNTYGNRWNKGQTGNPTGRPKTLHNEINHRLKEQNAQPVTRAEFVSSIRYLLNFTEKEMNELEQDTTTPVFLKWIIHDLKDKRTRPKILFKLLEFVLGK